MHKSSLATFALSLTLLGSAAAAHAEDLNGGEAKINVGDAEGTATTTRGGRIYIRVKDSHWNGHRSADGKTGSPQIARIVYNPTNGKVQADADLLKAGDSSWRTERARFSGTLSTGLSPTQVVQHLHLDSGDRWYSMRENSSVSMVGLKRAGVPADEHDVATTNVPKKRTPLKTRIANAFRALRAR